MYTIKFRKSAAKEWHNLNKNIQQQFAKKLKERAANPHIQSAKLHGMPNCYKIKLKAAGYRLVYEVMDNELIIAVVAVGRRDEIYLTMLDRV